MDDCTPPNDRIPHPSLSPHCEHAGALPLSSLGFTASPTPTRPIIQKGGRCASLFAITALPFRAPSQRGRRRSWGALTQAQVAVVCVHHPLLNPHPRRPRQHLSHHQIRTHTTVSPLSPPFHINANASAITHNSPNLRIKTRATASLPSLPFPIQLQHLIRG